MSKRHTLILISIILIIVACQKAGDRLPDTVLAFAQPKNFPAPVYNLESNPINSTVFELGKKLFYDPILSRNNTISCGTCHVAANAFTHHGHDLSHGIDDRVGIRNSMPLMNLAWADSFFWDGGVFHLDLSAIAPIENEVEMDESFAHVLQKLRQHESYPKLFENAFGSAEINSNSMLKALSQFMLMLVSADSKYDLVMRHEAQFTAEEQQGYKLFKAQCSSCHPEPLFTDYSFRDNGIGLNPANDLGRYEISQLEDDKLKFKVPSLRNLKYTAPYMHDGRFVRLDAVMNHYKREIQQTENLDPILKEKGKIELDNEETAALLQFLNTLNDEQFIKNKLFINE